MEAAGKWLREVSSIFQGKRISDAAVEKSLGDLRKSLHGENPGCFVSYAIENGRVLWLWVSKIIPDTFDGRVIIVKPFIMAAELLRDGFIRDLVDKARKFHKANKFKVQIGIAPSESEKIALCEKQGFKMAYCVLSGKVEDSLRAVSGKRHPLPSGYELRPLDMRRELEDCLRVTVLASKSEKTCRTYNVPVARMRRGFLRYLRGKSRKQVFGLYYNGGLVGNVIVSIEKQPKKMGLLGHIGILPEYTGKGLSANLYHIALSWLKSHGATRYVGCSSTDRVLSMANRMQRRIAATYLRI